ncbi:LuxR C-terminal-related transcriptional regulator [Francisellaceae bacterium]|nr:LuxR C-terminal-related transcriptional regulator [Francisellaceae bacterium]
MLKELSKYGLTPGIISILERYNITSIDNLKTVTKTSKLQNVPGFGYARIKRVNKALIKYDQAYNFLEQYIQKNENQAEPETVNHEFDHLQITSTQKEILHYLTQGDTNQDIRTKLMLSERSIRYHLHQLKLIYKAKTSSQLVYNILKVST